MSKKILILFLIVMTVLLVYMLVTNNKDGQQINEFKQQIEQQ